MLEIKEMMEEVVRELLGLGWNDQLMNDALDEFKESDGPITKARVFTRDGETVIEVTLTNPETDEVILTKELKLTLEVI